jgi:hypothetical protein
MRKSPIKQCFAMGLPFDSRFRDAITRQIETGDDWFSTIDLQELAVVLLPPNWRTMLDNALEDGDMVHFQNLLFERKEYGWRARKEWDVGEAVKKCGVLAKEVRALTGRTCVDLADERDRRQLWDTWQNSHTRSIQSDPYWREYWKKEDFPLETYNPGKAAEVCQRVAERFGPKPECTDELMFWFMKFAEGLPPESTPRSP